jgi:hypothetical protein
MSRLSPVALPETVPVVAWDPKTGVFLVEMDGEFRPLSQALGRRRAVPRIQPVSLTPAARAARLRLEQLRLRGPLPAPFTGVVAEIGGPVRRAWVRRLTRLRLALADLVASAARLTPRLDGRAGA